MCSVRRFPVLVISLCLLSLTVFAVVGCGGVGGGEGDGSTGDAGSPPAEDESAPTTLATETTGTTPASLPQQQINTYAFVSDALNGALEIFDLASSESLGQQVIVTGPDGRVVATFPSGQVVVTYESTPNKADWGKVIAQDPPAGTPLDSSTVIILTVGVPITITTLKDSLLNPDLTVEAPALTASTTTTAATTTTTKPKSSQLPPNQLSSP